MKHNLHKFALFLTILVLCFFIWLAIVFTINAFSKLEKHKTFYWFGFCPPGTSDSFEQSQNAFMPNDLIKANNICCPEGYYGTMTIRGKNLCCRNKFDCSND